MCGLKLPNENIMLYYLKYNVILSYSYQKKTVENYYISLNYIDIMKFDIIIIPLDPYKYTLHVQNNCYIYNYIYIPTCNFKLQNIHSNSSFYNNYV